MFLSTLLSYEIDRYRVQVPAAQSGILVVIGAREQYPVGQGAGTRERGLPNYAQRQDNSSKAYPKRRCAVHVRESVSGVVVAVLMTTSAWAANSVVIESKTVQPGETGVTIGVFMENDDFLVAVALPFEIRTVTGSAFISDNAVFQVNPLGRVSGSSLEDFVVRNYYGRKTEDLDPFFNACGPVAYAEFGDSPDIEPEFYISPDAILWVGFNTVSPAFPLGSDGALPSFSLIADVTTDHGTFEIDTVCVFRSNSLLFIGENQDLVIPSFIKGVITIEESPDHPSVTLDIKPRSCPNPLNIGRNWELSNDVLPVAILGNENIDVMEIDPSALWLEGVPPLRWDYADVSTPREPGVINDSCNWLYFIKCMDTSDVLVCDTIAVESPAGSGTFDTIIQCSNSPLCLEDSVFTCVGEDGCACTTAGPDGYLDLIIKFEQAAIVQHLVGRNPPRGVHTEILSLFGFYRDGTPFSASDCVRVQARGCHADPRCDGVTDVLDVVLAAGVSFRSEDAIIDSVSACPGSTTDVDCDGDTDILDVIRFVNVAFRNEDPAVQFCDP